MTRQGHPTERWHQHFHAKSAIVTGGASGIDAALGAALASYHRLPPGRHWAGARHRATRVVPSAACNSNGAHVVLADLVVNGVTAALPRDGRPGARPPRQHGIGRWSGTGGLRRRLHLPLTTLGMKPMTAERFACVALRGVARNRAIIVTPATPRIAWWLQRTSPKAMESVNRRAAGRVRVAMAALPAAGDQS